MIVNTISLFNIIGVIMVGYTNIYMYMYVLVYLLDSGFWMVARSAYAV